MAVPTLGRGLSARPKIPKTSPSQFSCGLCPTIFSKLVLTDVGTEIHFNFRKESPNFLNQQFSDQRIGQLIHLDNKRPSLVFAEGSESDSNLILAFSGSSVCEIGWATRQSSNPS